ncbi:hypothetical protein PpBr36_00860 [Pyricularia pennisetigena]|uniref:hypothetical protein n=1 Tax=Pyricularia pennisetigena TaxID=1578925 RepID=UPI001153A8D5|nr:hypothetical protein PpBr36_00860 [Pyricularia pennisetigena]TLS28519.1 hypothetical protein PpBr36_00860 [Pyricularia pennisetigena]
MAPSTTTLWIAALIVTVCDAAPTVSFPINSQVPPIARIGEPFEFVFSPTTFSSASPMTYTLSNPPHWLLIESGARRIFGTPREADIPSGQVVGVPITIVATDPSGSVSSPATLVVSRSPAPVVQIPPAEQVPKFGQPFSQPASVLSYPDKDFDYTFSPTTFSRTDLNYYAVGGDNSPLPAWISFDQSRLAFRGRTPPLSSLVNPPQAFEFKLMASDVVGFSAVSLSLFVVVGEHQLTTEETSLTINATIGSAVSDKNLKGKVRLDGKEVEPGDIRSAETPNIPSWLSFNKNDWEFQGMPPAGSRPTSFPLILQDRYGDSLNLTVKIDFATALFRSSLRELQVKPGSRLSFDLKPHLLNPATTEIELETNPASNWASYDVSTMVLSGNVPRNQGVSAATLVLKARSKNSDVTDERTLLIRISDAGETSSPTTLITAPTLPANQQPTPAGGSLPESTSQPSLPTSGSESNQGGGLPLGKILLAVLLPVTLLAIALFFLCLAWRRRRRRRSRTLDRKDISGPIPGSFMQVGVPEDSPMRKISKSVDVAYHQETPTKNVAPDGRAFSSAASRQSFYGFSMTPPPRGPNVSGSIPSAENGLKGGKSASSGWKSANIFAAATRKARRARSKSYLSDTSVYIDPQPFDVSTMPLPPRIAGSAGGAGSFRGTVEFGIPTLQSYNDSVQHTPERFEDNGAVGTVGTIESGRTVRKYYLPAAKSGEPGGSQEPMDMSPDDPATLPPACPQSRFSGYSKIDAYDQEQNGKGGGTLAGFASKLKNNNSSGSITTVDTFKDKATAARERRVGEHMDGGIINRPRPAALSGLPSSLPHGGRSQSAGFRGVLPRSTAPRPPIINISHHQTVFNDEMGGEWTPVPPDPLGISYEDIANSSPFNHSPTWSTIRSADRRASPTESGSSPFSGKPNWTILKEDDDSPVINEWVQRDGERRDGSDEEAGRGAGGSGLGIHMHNDKDHDVPVPRHPPADRSWDVGLGLSSLWKSSKRRDDRSQLSEVAINSSSLSPRAQERDTKYTSQYSVFSRWGTIEENNTGRSAGGAGSHGSKGSRGSSLRSRISDYRVFV